MKLDSTAIEPIFPEHRIAALEDLAGSVIERSAALAEKVRAPLRTDLAEITRWMHCYYSNLIEGQPTRIRDIEAALHHDFSEQPRQRDLQKLALAHLDCQRWASSYVGSPFAPDFFRELHLRFYSQLPEEMRAATTARGGKEPLQPGIFRDRDVQVGDHVSPPFELVPGAMAHFQKRYEEMEGSRARKIIAIGASHHRVAWIHPFRDGNGRVIRLFSDTLIRLLGIDGGGLWSLSRGLAIHRQAYYAHLAAADEERSSPLDGRGHLSESRLWEFCQFILETMLDQISSMDRLFNLEALAGRIEGYVQAEAELGPRAARVFLLLREALYRGEFSRGEAGRIVGASERTGRTALVAALGAGLLKSDTPKASVRLALPAKVLSAYFPRLFPPGSESETAPVA
jgi:Fic family protein